MFRFKAGEDGADDGAHLFMSNVDARRLTAPPTLHSNWREIGTERSASRSADRAHPAGHRPHSKRSRGGQSPALPGWLWSGPRVHSEMSLLVATAMVCPEGEKPAARSSE